MGHSIDLRFKALSQTPAKAARPRTQSQCVTQLPVYFPAFASIHTAWWQKHMGVNNLPRVVTWQWPGWELNPQPFDLESDSLSFHNQTTQWHPHLHKYYQCLRYTHCLTFWKLLSHCSQFRCQTILLICCSSQLLLCSLTATVAS